MAPVTRIDRLTKEQRDAIPAYRDKWIAKGLCTDPADWERGEAAIKECYRHAKLEEPRVVVRVGNPLVLALAGPIAAVLLGRLRRGVDRDGVPMVAVDEAVRQEVKEAVADAIITNGVINIGFERPEADSVHEALRSVEVANEVGRSVEQEVRETMQEAMASDQTSARLIENDRVDMATRETVREAVDALGSVGEAVETTVHAPPPKTALDGLAEATVRVAFRSPLSADEVVDEAVRAAVGEVVGSALVDDLFTIHSSVVSRVVHLALRASEALRPFGLGRAGDAVHGEVDAAVKSMLDGDPQEMHQAIKELWPRYIGGQFWAGYWCAFNAFFREVCELDLGEEMNARELAYRTAVESVCWWWPHKEFVIVCDRPKAIHRDERGRLHHPTQKAIEWRDGWGVYCVHGVRVPAYVVEHPEQITVPNIAAETNAEVRRVMIERYGVARYVKDSGCVVVHEDKDALGFPRRLLRKEVPDYEDIVMLEVTNSSPEPDGSRRLYHLRVHPQLCPLAMDGAELGKPQKMTCHNAVASLHGLRGEDYAPVFES